MEQRSDVNYRAEKLYKNSREKFGYLIREVVSNSIHATIIKNRLRPSEGFIPQVNFTAIIDEATAQIVVEDNGDGFTELNSKYFTHLDSRNIEKDELHFHPKGQGRLAIVFFTDNASYSSIYKNKIGGFERRIFGYPEVSASLFDLDDYLGSPTEDTETGTTLSLGISKQQTYGRAKTFFNKYSSIEMLTEWFIDNFFPFLMEDDKLNITIKLNEESRIINRSYIEKTITSVPFSVQLPYHEKPTEFKVWLISRTGNPRSRNQVICFARHLRAELEERKLEYEIDLPTSYDWMLTSDYLDDNVDQKGDKIEIDESSVSEIQIALNAALDSHFAPQIESNRKDTRKNIESAKTKFHSLSVFIDESKGLETKKILRESDIVSDAVEAKGRVERAYWTNQNVEIEEVGKLLNSSLHIYIEHRNKVLLRFKELIKRFDAQGTLKHDPEDDVHDLLLQRGKTLRDTKDKNHLHNLWILDDKYTIFSETVGALSSKNGQNASDIYMWTDDLEHARELLILELKSTSAAHNAGNKYESMVAQVKRYAAQFYRDPLKVLNWQVDPDRVLYSGVILARKSDINKELNSNNSGASPNKIPFLESSYYFNERFAVGENITAEPKFRDIRIEMYSYEDIYSLAMARNSVFFRLLKGEFSVSSET